MESGKMSTIIFASILGVFMLSSVQGEVSENCNVVNLTKLPVQLDFNFTLFMGKWYEIKWWDGVNHENDKHAMEGMSFVFEEEIPNQQALATLYGHFRDSDKCKKFNSKGRAKLYDVDPDNFAKMHYNATKTTSTNFWVVDTNYRSALVLQCDEIINGTCKPNVKINILGRKKDLDTATASKYAAQVERDFCIPVKNMTNTDLSRDCEAKLNGAGRIYSTATLLVVFIGFVMKELIL